MMKTNPNHPDFAGRRNPKPAANVPDTFGANRQQEAFRTAVAESGRKECSRRLHTCLRLILRPRSLPRSTASIPWAAHVPSASSGRVSGTIRRRLRRMLQRANYLSTASRIPTRHAMPRQADSKSLRRPSNQGSRRKTIKPGRTANIKS